MSPSFADLGVPAPLCATLRPPRHRRAVPHPGRRAARRSRRARRGGQGAHRVRQDAGLRADHRRPCAATPAGAAPAGPGRWFWSPPASWPPRSSASWPRWSTSAATGPWPPSTAASATAPSGQLLAKGPSVVVACPGRLEDLVAIGRRRARPSRGRRARRGRPHGRHGLPARGPPPARPHAGPPPDPAVLGHARRRRRHAGHPLPARPRPPRGGRRRGRRRQVEHLFWTVPRAKRIGADRRRRGPHRPDDRVHPHPPRRRPGRPPAGPGRGQGGGDPRRPHPVPAGPGAAPVPRPAGRRRWWPPTWPPAGIHVDGVACVVHFDLPDDSKDYVHRSGRTGRAGAPGIVVALVPEDGRPAARTLQRKLGRPSRSATPTSPPGRRRSAAPAARASGAGPGSERPTRTACPDATPARRHGPASSGTPRRGSARRGREHVSAARRLRGDLP